MSRRLKICSLALLLAGAGALWFWRPEPQHKGQPISYWVDRACQGRDDNKAWEFRQEVAQIGPRALPYVRAKLRVSDGWRHALGWMRAHSPQFIQRRWTEPRLASEIRYSAVRTLGAFGSNAAPAVNDLIALLPEEPRPTIETLGVIGPPARAALPALRAQLTNQSGYVRVEVATALWHIAGETNAVLDICTNVISAGPSDGTVNALGLLGNLGPGARPAVPLLVRVLQDTNYPTGARGNAAITLGNAGLFNPEVQAALLAATNVPKSDLHCNAAMALWQSDPQYAPLAIELVLRNQIALKKRLPKAQIDFTKWLDYRRLDPQQAIAPLRQWLRSDSAEMRDAAADALKKIEAKLTPAERELR